MNSRRSFDHLVGAGEKRRRHVEAHALFHSFPNQHVDASPAVRVERERGSRQGYTITISFDGSDLFRAEISKAHPQVIARVP